jgi:hypothetical protein
VIGGGSTPDQRLGTWLVAVPGAAHRLEKRLRARGVVARVENGELVLDLRTVLPAEEAALEEAVGAG